LYTNNIHFEWIADKKVSNHNLDTEGDWLQSPKILNFKSIISKGVCTSTKSNNKVNKNREWMEDVYNLLLLIECTEDKVNRDEIILQLLDYRMYNSKLWSTKDNVEDQDNNIKLNNQDESVYCIFRYYYYKRR
jgi:hypothetical protein